MFNETYERYPKSEYLNKLNNLNILPIDLKFKGTKIGFRLHLEWEIGINVNQYHIMDIL